MPNVMKSCCIAAMCLMLLPVALAQSEIDFSSEADPNRKLTQEELDSYSEALFGADIRAGKITRQQAGVYVSCISEEKAATARTHKELHQEVRAGFAAKMRSDLEKTPLSAGEKARLARVGAEYNALMDRIEKGCMKKAGVVEDLGKSGRGTRLRW